MRSRETLTVNRSRATQTCRTAHPSWCVVRRRPISPTDENELWHDLIDDAELPPIEQYSTRHTAATLLESLGVPADVRMQIMGQNSKVAHQAYVHVDQSRTRPALDKLAAAVLG